MRSGLAAQVLEDWLETEVSRAIGGQEHISLAYSGGLGSTLVAAIARKHCDVTCFVVAVGDAEDLRAAKLAADYLDYRIEKIRPSRSGTLALIRRIAAMEPEAKLEDLFTMAPTFAVRERAEEGLLLTGFGLEEMSKPMRNLLAPLRTTNPLLPLHVGGGPVDRKRFIECAEILGLPRKFGRPRHRPPGSGSGVERSMRALAASRDTSVRRLVRPRDYHIRPKVRSRRFD